ncbi:hypothetical protein ACE1TH_18295 [Shouchella sp. JSM 1781072]|uniref:hypothetical protein n=1 Tax=Bacillaceae TaxID=186817 RepID=UPI000C079408|nr:MULTISPECIES: hypothetical protein [Bacillaceae]UTR07656.1 hypothetical protein MM326_06395 [Alkalihalobacillus sp. LMS6]
MEQTELQPYLKAKLEKAKTQFERTIDCKHTEFDDLYPYISEQPQFFWYKRYVAWQELLTLVQMASDFNVNWEELFLKKQTIYIKKRILDAKVLDNWYEQSTADSAQ